MYTNRIELKWSLMHDRFTGTLWFPCSAEMLIVSIVVGFVVHKVIDTCLTYNSFDGPTVYNSYLPSLPFVVISKIIVQYNFIEIARR